MKNLIICINCSIAVKSLKMPVPTPPVTAAPRTALVLGVRNAGSAYGTGTIYSTSSSSSSILETLSSTVYRVSRAGVLK